MVQSALANKKVLILGGEENPALPVLKSLGNEGVHLTVASHLSCAPGLFSKYTSIRLRSPDPWKGEQQYTAWTLDECNKNSYDLLLPLGEKATLWIANNQDAFKPYTHVPFPVSEVYMIGRDKALTMKVADRLGIPIPTTYYPDEEPIKSIAQRVDYPVVVKPRISYGARGIYYPKNPQQLEQLHDVAVHQYGPCIIQEYIPQTGMQYKVESILDRNHKVRAVGVYDKPRYFPPTGGSSTLNRTVHRLDLCQLSTIFLEGISWYGMGDLDFIEDPRDNIPKLMEMNPRFTRSIRILTEAGLPFPKMLLELAIGEMPAEITEYKIGLHMRYLLSDCVWFLKSSERWRANPSFFKFFGKNLIYEMLSLEDPLPSIIYLWGQLYKAINKKSRARLFRRPDQDSSAPTI